jgi:hypothetical protein
MVENTYSTTLEVQGSFALTYMVGFISLNLRSYGYLSVLILYSTTLDIFCILYMSYVALLYHIIICYICLS